MSYAIFIFLNILLIQLPFSNEDGCTYYTASGTEAITGDDYLKGSNADENKQSCFSLSTGSKKCCYNKDSNNKETCVEGDISATGPNCPDDSEINNNCGMALFYKPVSKEACTEISLVNGYCCFVKTKTKGSACLKQDEIDEDEKDEITDYMKDYFRNRLGYNPDEEIVSVQCEGSLLKYYGFLMVLLSVICL